jgi:PAS domain S-box-containing protein
MAQAVTAFERRVVQLFLRAMAACDIACAALLALVDLPIDPSVQSTLALGVLAMGVLCAGAAMRLSTLDLRRTVAILATGGQLLIVVAAWALGTGLQAVLLGMAVLLAVGAIVLCGARIGLGVAAVAAAGLALLAFGEASGPLAASGSVAHVPIGVRLVMHGLVLSLGCVLALLVSRVVRRAVIDAAQREQRFRQLLDMAADWYWELDREHRFLHVAERRPGASGLPLADQLGRAPWDVPGFGLSGDQLDAHRADLAAQRPFAGLLARRTGPDGGERWVRLSGEPRFAPGGRFIGFWGVGRDVTAEVLAQRAVAASEARYRELFARSPSAVLLHREGRVVEANDAAARLFGFPDPRAMAGLAVADDLVAPAQQSPSRERLARLEALAPGEGLPVVELQLRARDGRPLTAELTSVRVDTPSGPASLSMLLDVTERLAVQAALRHSEALLSSLVTVSPDAITLTDFATGRYRMVNDAFLRLTGYARDDVLGRTSFELGLWADPADREALLAAIAANGRSTERLIRFIGKDGRPLQLAVSAAAFELDGVRWLVTNSRDITASERARLEREAVLGNAAMGIAFTRSMRFEFTNRRFDGMLGWPEGTLLGRPTREIWPDDASFAEVRAACLAELDAGRSYETERALMRRDGERVWCRLLAQPLDPADASQGVVWIAEDVTARRAAESALAQARDEAQAANRAKSAFLANTSHELRTPLNGLVGLAHLALHARPDDPQREAYLRQIDESARALAAIIADILDFSRIEAGRVDLQPEPFDLPALAESVVQISGAVATARGLALSLTVDPGVPRRLLGDPVRVRQILSNFVANALKFTERGSVRVAVSVAPAGGVRLCVTDTGPGIPLEVQARLFQPFVQADASITRRHGGTGLGLSIVRQLAEAMGGSVGLLSRPGEGASFWADLPLPPAPDAPPVPAPGGPLPLGRRVLVVEDHPVNMLVTVALLEQAGLRVGQAHDGQQAVVAVAAAEAAGDPFDLVLMDVQMPVMGGYEATRQLRARPGSARLPIVALTAAALVGERDTALAVGMDDFLTKPIDLQALHAVLRRHLGPRRPAAEGSEGGAAGGPAAGAD